MLPAATCAPLGHLGYRVSALRTVATGSGGGPGEHAEEVTLGCAPHRWGETFVYGVVRTSLRMGELSVRREMMPRRNPNPMGPATPVPVIAEEVSR